MCKTLQLHWISACKSDTHVKIKTSDSQVGHVGRSLLIIQNLCLFKLRPFKQSTFWVWMLSEAKRNVSLQRISRHIFCWQQQEITWPLQIDLIGGTLLGTNISPQNGILKMIFLFPRWDMLIPWRVSFGSNFFQSVNSKTKHHIGSFPQKGALNLDDTKPIARNASKHRSGGEMAHMGKHGNPFVV